MRGGIALSIAATVGLRGTSRPAPVSCVVLVPLESGRQRPSGISWKSQIAKGALKGTLFNPPIPISAGGGSMSMDGGWTGDSGCDNGAAAQAAAEIAALTDAITALRAQIEDQTKRTENVQRLYNTSQSNYGVLAKAIADVASGQLGGRMGLGFMIPGFSGGGARY